MNLMKKKLFICMNLKLEEAVPISTVETAEEAKQLAAADLKWDPADIEVDDRTGDPRAWSLVLQAAMGLLTVPPKE